MKLKLDLHDIYNSGAEIEKALKQMFDEAVAKKAPLIEIIPGKGSGQLKKHVLRFLEQEPSSCPNTSADGEGLQELRPHLRPLPLEIAGGVQAAAIAAAKPSSRQPRPNQNRSWLVSGASGSKFASMTIVRLG